METSLSVFTKAYYMNAVVQSIFYMFLYKFIQNFFTCKCRLFDYHHLFITCRSWLCGWQIKTCRMNTTFSWMYTVVLNLVPRMLGIICYSFLISKFSGEACFQDPHRKRGLTPGLLVDKVDCYIQTCWLIIFIETHKIE